MVLLNIIKILFLIINVRCFHLNPTKRMNNMVLNDDKVPPMWSLISMPLKEQARRWFINRAILKGIDWEKLTDYYKMPTNFAELEEFKSKLEDTTVKYPGYFLKPFHGYDEGNMNWLAAQENEAASLSMCVNYWKGVCALDSERWVRYNISKNIKSYIRNTDLYDSLESILDVGCSGGISTEYLKKGFPQVSNIYGLDLSPYFVSVGAFRSEKQNANIEYVHANAEKTPFSENTFDLIVCNFLFHEVPPNATQIILDEMMRILTPGGVLAVVDLDPEVLKGDALLSQFRKWAFEVTEPHIYNYYKSNMSKYLEEGGFQDVVKKSNDPINAVWLGRKSTECSDCLYNVTVIDNNCSTCESDSYKKLPKYSFTGFDYAV
tara:strand:- start:1860 stop:2990 length:1131 start_codon:yes stop_codon:yes gene_type:complete